MKLTKHQRIVLGMMLDGWYISVYCDYSNNIEYTCLTDGNNCDTLRKDTLNSLLKKGLIVGKSVYSTVQPDTESFEYRLIRNNYVRI